MYPSTPRSTHLSESQPQASNVWRCILPRSERVAPHIGGIPVSLTSAPLLPDHEWGIAKHGWCCREAIPVRHLQSILHQKRPPETTSAPTHGLEALPVLFLRRCLFTIRQ